MTDAFATYLLAERRYSELTVRNYTRDVAAFMDYLGVSDGDFRPGLVTADDIRGWIVSLTDSGKLSAASVNCRVSSVRSFFRWLRASGVIAKDPFLKIGTLKTPHRLPVWIPEVKMESITAQLLRSCEGGGDVWERRDSIILLLFYSCGIRLAELLDMRTGDISEAYDSVRVRGKGGKERVVPLPSVTGGVLKRYVDEITSLDIWKLAGNKLFLTVKGTPLSRTSVYVAVRGGLERMGVQGKRSPHVLRHTFATHLLDNGADIREIQELLGHSSLSATQVYTHNSISHLKKAYRTAHPRSRGPEKEETGDFGKEECNALEEDECGVLESNEAEDNRGMTSPQPHEGERDNI